jgi:hypothetical protein
MLSIAMDKFHMKKLDLCIVQAMAEFVQFETLHVTFK